MQDSLYCKWLWHTMTVLCDGTVTCGLDDPFKKRDYGNLKKSSVRDIFSSMVVQETRQNLLAGSPCQTCRLYEPAKDATEQQLKQSGPYPKTLIIESSIRCNIRCRNSVCDVANDSTFHIRREDFMQWPLFCKIIDEAAKHIENLYFFNYGEPFINPKALDMLAYAKKANPKLIINTSTNGILLAKPGIAERLIGEDLLDRICFTIGGCDEETYGRYHKAGSFAKAMEGMRRLADEKRRQGKAKPIIHWRYLVFNWNDTDENIAEALRLKDEIGVDEFKFMLTSIPMEGRSLRRAPGTPGYRAIADWISYENFYTENPMAEAGLWGVEHSPKLGKFSWTGSKTMIQLTPEDGVLTVRLARPGQPMVAMPTVKVRTPWEEAICEVGRSGWKDNVIRVPEEHSQQTILVELDINPTFSPLRTGESADSRDLGVMLSMEGVKIPTNPYRSLAGAAR